MHVKRILSMIKDGDDKSSQNDFKTLSVNGARQIIKKFIVDENTVEKLVECVESETITGFQLKDIMSENFNFSDI